MQNLITPGVLSLVLLLIGAILFLFSASNVFIMQSRVLIDEKARPLMRFIGLALILIGLFGVLRDVFFSSQQMTSNLPTASDIPTSLTEPQPALSTDTPKPTFTPPETPTSTPSATPSATANIPEPNIPHGYRIFDDFDGSGMIDATKWITSGD